MQAVGEDSRAMVLVVEPPNLLVHDCAHQDAPAKRRMRGWDDESNKWCMKNTTAKQWHIRVHVPRLVCFAGWLGSESPVSIPRQAGEYGASSLLLQCLALDLLA